ncbi:MAG: hypothetical protein WCF90_05950 [Methanomicrobiales archaeon]
MATQVGVPTPSQSTCTFHVNWEAPGHWDVVVADPYGQEAVLPGGFELTEQFTRP